MKTNASLRRKSVKINHSRWVAYATAGAATVFASARFAEADITYSGIINRFIQGPFQDSSIVHFQLDQPGDSIELRVFSFGEGYGRASFFLRPAIVSGAVAGFRTGGYTFVSKLGSGQKVSLQPFGGPGGILGSHYRLDPNASQWVESGTGFVGFRFNGNVGLQYGWARITTGGESGGYDMTLVDYAFGDVGDSITAGQTSSNVPESGGSLGLFALGCAGLLAWRARRADVAETAAAA